VTTQPAVTTTPAGPGTNPVAPVPAVSDRQPGLDAVNPAARAVAPPQPALPLQSFAFTTRKVVRSASKGDLIEERRAAYYEEDIGAGVNIRMVEIPRGAFLMGDPAPVTERPQHPVTIKSFFMGEFEVTQQQWRAVAKLPRVKIELNPDPSYFKGDDLP